MSGAHCRIASATTMLPVTASVFCSAMLLTLLELAAFGRHRDGVHRALVDAHAAAFAVVVVERGDLLVGDVDGRVRAHDPAQQALRAHLVVPERALAAPAAGAIVAGVTGLGDHRSAREILGRPLTDTGDVPFRAHADVTSSYALVTDATFAS